MEFVWGIKSADDFTYGDEAKIYTLNDFDIIYLKNDKKYIMGVETIYDFRDGRQSEKVYLERILKRFTEWMIANDYDTTQEVNIVDIFTKGYNINTEFNTIEELYATFKVLVNGF